jgi:hypothetical protein
MLWVNAVGVHAQGLFPIASMKKPPEGGFLGWSLNPIV